MSKEVLVIVCGVATALSPFVGLPGDWRAALVVLLGCGLAVLGFMLRSETLSRGGIERSSFFIDNRHRADVQASDAATHSTSDRIQ